VNFQQNSDIQQVAASYIGIIQPAEYFEGTGTGIRSPDIRSFDKSAGTEVSQIHDVNAAGLAVGTYGKGVGNITNQHFERVGVAKNTVFLCIRL